MRTVARALWLIGGLGLAAVAHAAYTVQWDNDDTANKETGFAIERSTDGRNFSQVASVAASTTSYTDSAANSTSTYWYRIRSFISFGTATYYSSYSEVITNAPAFTTEPPATLTQNALASTTLTVAASGLPAPTYQWQVSFDGGATWSPLADGNGIAGSATASLTLSNLNPLENGLYACVAANGFVPNALSSSTALTVTPSSQTITFGALGSVPFAANETITLAGTASSGLAVSYSSSNTAVAPVSGGVLTVVGYGTATITASQAGNAGYTPAPTVSQKLTVSAGAQTITFPSIPAVTYSPGETITLAATSSSGLPVVYSVTNTAVATVNGNILTILAGGTTGVSANQPGNSQYQVATRQQQVLTVNLAPQAITFGTLPTLLAGGPAYTLTATASSGLPVAYSLSGPSIATLSGNTITVGSSGGSVTVLASQFGNNCYSAATSVKQTLVINQAPVFTTQPAAAATSIGARVSIVAVVSAYPSATYQWQVSTDGGKTWSSCSGSVYGGATASTLNVTPPSAAYNGYCYRCVASNAAAAAASNAAVLTINIAPAISAQPASQNTTYGGNATFSVTASGQPPPTFQWQISTTAGGSTFVNLSNSGTYSGVTSANLSVTNTTTSINGFNYRCVITNSVSAVTSNVAQLTVGTVAPQITTAPASESVAAGGTVDFTAAASGGPEPTLQWQLSSDGGATWSNLAANSVYSGVTSGTLTLASAPVSLNNDEYRIVATNSAGTASSTAGTLTVTTVAPGMDSSPQNATVLSGGTATFTAGFTGAPAPTVQWQVSTDGGSTWKNLSEGAPYSGTQTTTLTVAGVTSGQNSDQYRCVATNSAGSIASSAATLTLGATAPVVTADPSSVIVSNGAAATFTAAAETGTALTERWQISTNGGTSWANVEDVGVFSGSTTTTLYLSSTAAAFDSAQFRLVFANNVGATPTASATLTVLTVAPTFSQQPAAVSLRANSTATFVVAAAGQPTPLYQWLMSADGGTTWVRISDGSPYSGTQTSTLVVSPITAAMTGDQYECQAYNDGGVALSNPATLTVSASAQSSNSVPVPTKTQTINFSTIGAVSPGISVTLVATATSGLPVALTVLSGSAVITGGNVLVVNDDQPVVIQATQAGNGTYYGAPPVQQTVSAGSAGSHTYFGSFGSEQASSSAGGLTAHAASGSFAAVLNAGGQSGTLMGSLSNPQLSFILNFQAANGAFSGSVASLNADGTTGQTLTIAGQITAGAISGTLSPLGLSFSGSADPAGGSSSGYSGFYPGNGIYSIVGTQSQVFVVAVAGSSASAGSGALGSNGSFSVQTSNGTTVSATLDDTAQTIAGSVSPASNTQSTSFSGSLGSAAPAVTASLTSASAGATLTLSTPAVSGATYQWQYYGVNLAGATASTLNLRNVGAYQGGLYSVVVTSGGRSSTSSGATVSISESARLVNLSANGYAGTTPATGLVAGFVVQGSGTKQLLLRGVGPTLGTFNVPGEVTDALLTVYDGSSEVVATDHGWANAPLVGVSTVGATISAATAADFDSVFAFALNPGSLDSAMKTDVPTGSFTAENTATGSSAGGTGLVEVYDLDSSTSSADLTNLSCRAPVSSGHSLIAGFVISGTTSQTVLLRAVGPTLGSYGVTGVLSNPRLTLYDDTSTAIAVDSGWGNASTLGTSSVAAGIQSATASLMGSVYAFSLQSGSADSAIIATLPPGSYTVVIDSPTGASGTALVEIYDLP
jgi:hypothetical protein